MTMVDAIDGAESAALMCGAEVALVREGPHADEFAELDEDGQSYGYCPLVAVPILYKWGEILKTVSVNGRVAVWSS
jgi:hypothetical protein